MKILITGGAGFVGSHLCEKYTKNGDTVLCLDNFMNGNLMNIRHLLNHRNFKLIQGDIQDYDLLEKLMRDVDAVFHLAAQIHVDRSIIEPKLTYDINVLGTQNILEVARMYDVEKIVHASTSEVYGSAEYAPMDEKHPLNAPHPYGASKIAADRMCYAYIETYGMNICIMRPFNLYGPRQKDSGYGGAISIFTKRVLSNMPPIIYGSGEQTRDYTYVEDIVRAYDLILAHSKPIREPVNFGTGVDVKINDLATKIIKLCGKDMKPVHVDGRPGEVDRLIADITKAKKLGWKPKFSLDMGLEKFVDWYQNYKFEEWAKPR
nr:GDP-mannose 4,6-dehydratase [uncultured Methanoregula sp.]